eukprot:CAMPEP_0185733548 /NCGR_PEP_ID=MMETSP1171-20130828/19856_1 /TAXON_ID=374046 /ORGANISM="Helicotheca tamensis, Strain CCMP826" /LENGTH=84 /DNA_ID=CAMNT_0028403311 /DNA_START=672 /DNA_END=923 /DNA_ORIENTATION=+
MARTEALLEREEDCATTRSNSCSEEERIKEEHEDQEVIIAAEINSSLGVIRPEMLIYMEDGGYQSISPSPTMSQMSDRLHIMKE